MQLVYVSTMMSVGLVMLFLLLISKDQVMLKLKAMIKRKKNYLLVHELGKDKKLYTKLGEYTNSLVNTGGKRYQVDKEHIHVDPAYNIPAVVVSDSTSRSINPQAEDTQVLSPTTVDESVLAAVMGPEFRKIMAWLQINTIIIAVQVLVIIGMGFVIWMLVNGAKEAGITLAM